jgi:RNA polymerase sigma-70 factor (ECF subfamily)
MWPVGPSFDVVLRGAQGGDHDALAALWRELNPPLVRYLRARDREAAEDVASETWIKAARSLVRFRGTEGQFRAWLFTIARNGLIDWRLRAQRRPAVALDPDDLRTSAAADDPASEAIEALDTEAALRLVALLPDSQADVILLRVVAGLDAARVADIVGKREATVRVLQHRGLRRLAELLRASSGQGVTRCGIIVRMLPTTLAA